MSEEIARDRLGKLLSITAKKELEALPRQLLPDEIVLNMVVGDFAQEKHKRGKGLLVLTDRRVIFLNSSGAFVKKISVEDFALKHITSIRADESTVYGELSISTSGGGATLSKAQPKERAHEIAQHIRGLM